MHPTTPCFPTPQPLDLSPIMRTSTPTPLQRHCCDGLCQQGRDCPCVPPDPPSPARERLDRWLGAAGYAALLATLTYVCLGEQ